MTFVILPIFNTRFTFKPLAALFFLSFAFTSMNIHSAENKLDTPGFIQSTVKNAETTPTHRTFYFDALNGSNKNNGLSYNEPKKTLSFIASLNLQPGDSILLKRGSIFFNDSIVLSGQKGTVQSPIVVSSYGEGKLPIIDNESNGAYAITVKASESIHIENIEIIGGKGGIFFPWVKELVEFKHFVFRNLFIHTILKANGIAFDLNNKKSKEKKHSEYTDILIENCRAEMIGRQFIKGDGLNNIVIRNNKFSHSGGPGIVIFHSNQLTIQNNTVSNTGSRAHSSFFGRGSCGWILNVRDALIEKNTFENAQGWHDSYGFHLDIGNFNVVVQYNLSRNNAGGFVQVLGKNKNTSYRYNISINDGWRTQGTYDFPDQKNISDGCIISVNGYTANGEFQGPYNTYIYNNTIYVKEDITACFQFRSTLSGLLVANNIFHISGNSKDVTGKLKEREPEGKYPADIVFKNNLYLKNTNLPLNMMVVDSEKRIGDPLFIKAGGKSPEDYIPNNKHLVKDKGIKILKIPNDPFGLHPGLDVKSDFFGNEIVNNPDLGAIEIN